MRASRRRFLSAMTAGASLAARAVPAAGEKGQPLASSPTTFPQLEQEVHGHRLVYLDSAATTLRPTSVIEALVAFYRGDNANPSRVHALAGRAADRLVEARRAVARFVNAADPSEIIFVRGTTEGVNLVAGTFGLSTLRAGDEVLLTIAEHNSHLMPWMRVARQVGARLRFLDVEDDGRFSLDRFQNLLSERTRVVAFSHVSNVLGYVNPVKEMCTLARRAGARVIVDGAQGAPHVKIDVQDLGCDFYVFSGHKMLGPMATGVVWGRGPLLEEMPPYHVGSNMAHNVDLEHAEYEVAALKFQAGTPDVAGPVGLAAAVQFLERVGHDALAALDADLVRHGLNRLQAVPGLRLIGPVRADLRLPVFTFVMKGHSAAAIARALDARGIAIRAGDMAALPLLTRFGVRDAARASAYVYSTRADLDRLAAALHDLRA
jgi:cysteine desulfurase/selenocysteine lyase